VLCANAGISQDAPLPDHDSRPTDGGARRHVKGDRLQRRLCLDALIASGRGASCWTVVDHGRSPGFPAVALGVSRPHSWVSCGTAAIEMAAEQAPPSRGVPGNISPRVLPIRRRILAQMRGRSQPGELGTPEDIGYATACAGPATRRATSLGQAIVVDGGRYCERRRTAVTRSEKYSATEVISTLWTPRTT